MNHLKPYPNDNNSGVPWLGEVPEHWNVNRGKWLFEKMERPCRENDDVVTCFRDGMVSLRKNRRIRGFTESIKEIGYQGIRKGDLVIHAMDAFAGAIGVSDSDGKGTPVYQVLHPKEMSNSYYYAYTLREMARSQWILALAKGIRERSTDFRYDDFASQILPIPPLPEQAAIVRYLDYMDRRIRRLINAKRKLIALLNEQKHAIVHQAVTRGLNPNVPLKPSRVEWLGDIPEHWEVRRLKSAFRKIIGGSTPSSTEQSYWDGDIVWVTPRDISHSEKITTSLRKISRLGFNSCSTELVPSGSIVVTSRAPVGNVSLACVELCTNQGCKALVPDEAIIKSSFALEVLRVIKAEIQSFAVGTTFTEISTTNLGAIVIPVPPLNEQTAILQFLNKSTADIRNAIAHAQHEIDLLREYNIRLIADVVTGKLDVREAVANLPEEVEIYDDVDIAAGDEDVQGENELESAGVETVDEE